MYRILLISMPFADLATPSIALTQLRAVTERQCRGRVAVEIVYLTHDFGRFFGVEDYTFIWNSSEARQGGLGEWLFRRIAFPELPDNTGRYLSYMSTVHEASVARVEALASRRDDMAALVDRSIEEYGIHRADMVGFTSMFMQNAASFGLARKIKARNPNVITVIGGANCEYPMGAVIAARVPPIDFVFSGPALRSFPDFVRRALDGHSHSAAGPGVFSRHFASQPSGGETIGPELDIDDPIPLEYDAFVDRVYEYFPDRPFKPVLTIETSRGCWWGQRAHCTFCGLNGSSMAFRAMAPDRATAALVSAFRHRGRVSVIQAVDNIMPKDYVKTVLPYLNTPADMQIFYEVKADMKRGELEQLARAGVTLVQPGIEALATSTLKLMKKGTSSLQNVSFLKNCLDLRIRPFWNLLVGFPFEPVDSYRRYTEILPLLTHLNPPTGVYPVRFDRYSPYHEQQEVYHLDLRPMEFYALVYPFTPPDLKDFAYYFADHSPEAQYARSAFEWLGALRELADAWKARWTSRAFRLDPPMLRFVAKSLVLDSRSDLVIEHHVGPLAEEILREADKPVHVDRLLTSLSAGRDDAACALNLLLDQGLMLRDGDHVISLVGLPDAVSSSRQGDRDHREARNAAPEDVWAPL